MANLIGSGQFLGDSVNIFTDERTAASRLRVIEWLNDLPTAEPQQKCELLVKIQETTVGANPELIEEFLEQILSLAHDSNMEVRKQVVIFIEQICKVKVDLLPQCINVVSMLLRDRSPQVIKRVIQACGSIYKNGLQWICEKTEDITDSTEQAWNVLSLVKAQILDLIDNENDGIRTNAIKFLETTVILQSYADEDSQKREDDFSLKNIPENSKLIKRQKLEEEAINIFSILLQFHSATHVSSINLITCSSSLCTIAKLRPSFMNAVVEAFKTLCGNLPPTFTDSQQTSVRKSLKMYLIGLLKHRGAFEFQSTLKYLLLDLGASQGEIQRALPKMDKQEMARRQKRILENAANELSKRIKLSTGALTGDVQVSGGTGQQKAQKTTRMVLDEVELDKQKQKSARVNEKFVAEQLRSLNVTVNLIIEFLPKLPDAPPESFLTGYTPIIDLSVPQQIAHISKAFAEQMTDQRVGPGAAAFTKEPPMRAVEIQEPEAMDIDSSHDVDDDQRRAEEATKKLRENMERAKGEQQLIERMKQRAKTLKLQEVSKPLSRQQKEKFILDAVKRICMSERQCVAGGVAMKRRQMLSVIAATFPDNVRYSIFDFIMLDIRHRINLAFSWLFEEYCLLQGYTRHSYVKSENRPDYAYNELLNQLVAGVVENCEFKEKILLLRRLYLEAPILPEDAINRLIKMCKEDVDYSQHGLDLMKDIVLYRPPRKFRFLRILQNFSVHDRSELRQRALSHIVELYHQHKTLPNRIEEFCLEWASFLEKETPPAKIYSEEFGRTEVEATWKEEIAKICLSPLLAILPYNAEGFMDKLCKVFLSTSNELKRSILRFIDGTIKQLGPDHPTILKLIKDCPSGTEHFVIRVIYILTDRLPTPPTQLVQYVRELYASSKLNDVRVLIPVLSGLTRQEILNALPKILKLSPAVVKEVFNRLLGIGAEYAFLTIAVSPIDILVALHTIDPAQCDLKSIVRATALCLAEKEIYTQDVLIVVLQRLVEVTPTPTLLMRTMIQSLSLYPTMSTFILNLLKTLVLKQVWRQKVIWEGFLKCVQRLKPQSLAVMLMLPPQHLSAALQQCPDLRQPLMEYAESIRDEPMNGITPQILDIIMGKSVDVFVTDESGGYITVDNIKKETEMCEDSAPATASAIVPLITTASPVVTTMASSGPPKAKPIKIKTEADQPLPPGEE